MVRFPDYLGRALTIFDPGSGQYDDYRNVVANQSVISLAYKDGFIYGGTSVSGGLGLKPAETEAKLFKWDMQKKEKVWEGVPISGVKTVSALTFDADGYLWGLTAGKLFKFDPNTREIVKSAELRRFILRTRNRLI